MAHNEFCFVIKITYDLKKLPFFNNYYTCVHTLTLPSVYTYNNCIDVPTYKIQIINLLITLNIMYFLELPVFRCSLSVCKFNLYIPALITA